MKTRLLVPSDLITIRFSHTFPGESMISCFDKTPLGTKDLKPLSHWFVHYFTSTPTYYPFPNNQIRFLDIPKLEALLVVQMEEHTDAVLKWAYG